jgi:hypothetical protein
MPLVMGASIVTRPAWLAVEWSFARIKSDVWGCRHHPFRGLRILPQRRFSATVGDAMVGT